ncbi:MAG: tRNA epoxyqueuosine(34) reductase QueG [candidate division Zixibacteria bacterium]|nr:tRNA epoxyqueuosine(34) reductase QueG [candidate division Zixibacteria bacterium]
MPESTAQQLRERLVEVAHELGFDAVGVASVDSDGPDRERLFEWLTLGYHASMTWMARNAERRSDVRQVLPGARSVISLAVNYYTPHEIDDGCGSLKVSRYAWGEDYHRVLTRRLKLLCEQLAVLAPGEKFIAYVDTGPVMERAWAERAGLGWIGKNGCLITRSLGSWVFLAEVITTVPLPVDLPHTDFCGSCTRCIDACPTDAITEPCVVDSNRCISYWTIEHKGEIPAALAADFDGWIFGCDVCQDVCPWNSFTSPSAEPAFAPRADCLCPPGDRWATLSGEEFREEFADSAIRRAKSEGLARNIRIQDHDPLRRALATAPTKLSDADNTTSGGHSGTSDG